MWGNKLTARLTASGQDRYKPGIQAMRRESVDKGGKVSRDTAAYKVLSERSGRAFPGKCHLSREWKDACVDVSNEGREECFWQRK